MAFPFSLFQKDPVHMSCNFILIKPQIEVGNLVLTTELKT